METTISEHTKKHLSLHAVYLMTFILAACSLLYELLIAHTIATLAANTVVWYSVTIGVFLGALGFGSILYKRFLKAQRHWSMLFWVEILLSFFGLLAPIGIHLGHIAFANNVAHGALTQGYTFVFFGTAIVMILIVGFLTGMELPLLFDCANEQSYQKKVTNRVLGIDYLGSLFAGFIFPLVLLPRFEVIGIGFGVASVNFLIALYILVRVLGRTGQFTWRMSGILVLLVIITSGFVKMPSIEQYFLQKYYYYYEASADEDGLFASMKGDVPEVERFSSPYQKIDIVESTALDIHDYIIDGYSTKYTNDNNWPIGYYLFLNGDYQLNSSVEEIYHEYFAHVPIMMRNERPKNVLVLGGGDGLLLRELVKYDDIEKITHVDLDSTLIELSKTHPVLSYMNQGSNSDPRIETIITDGLQYLRNTEEQYDAIYIDFPYAVDYNLSKLYSAELFSFVHKRLQDDGYSVFDATGVGSFSQMDEQGNQVLSSDSEWPYYYHTLRKAGFETIIPYVSNLETDNKNVAKLLDETDLFLPESNMPDPLLDFGEDVDEARIVEQENIQTAIQDFVWSLQQGFIIMKKGEKEARDVDITYHKQDVPLHVLNKKRFKLAFALPFPFEDEIDESKVNSVERPTLPYLPFWYVRLPY